MKAKFSFLAGLLVIGAVNAQGFADEPTCYSWQGGYKSAGSFTKCEAPLAAAKKPEPKPLPPPPPAAIIQPGVSCPNIVILEPEPQKHRSKKPKPRPKLVPRC